MKCSRGILAAVLIVGGSLVGAAAVADDTGGEAGVLLGVSFPDKDLTGENDLIGDLGNNLAIGLHWGTRFTPHWGWTIQPLYSTLDTTGGGGDAETISGRLAFEYMFDPNEHGSSWFTDFGAGWLGVDFDVQGAGDFDRIFASAGFGKRRYLRGTTNFRWQARVDHTVTDDGLGERDLTMGYLLLGLTWGPTGDVADDDGDGVGNGRDKCPDTPRGATVDKYGCPSDADGDGVYDGIDKCPGTPKGWPVNPDGCPKDSDGDGVVDGEDKCPGTPAGATIDSRGCPTDADGDGVYDGIDRCPDTPKGATVDSRGCPTDSDGDGVFDGIDQCPRTPRGATVDDRGCPTDSDGDGVMDGIDKCPGTPPGTSVDEKGCPRSAPIFEPEKRTVVLEGVQFATNSADLTPASRSILDRVADSLRDWPELRVRVGGHTDSTGSDEYNLKLSQRRAESVRAYLAGKGIAATRLEARGYGESKPIGDNATDAGRTLNRRVELERMD